VTIKLREDAKEAAYELLPPHMIPSVIGYFEEGWQPGGFLSAVLANDLVGAFAHADARNKPHIGDFIQWLYWHAPGRPFGWGSYEAIDKWVKEAQQARDASDPIEEEVS